MTMTYDLARAAAFDAANAQMRAAGREHWSEEDYILCCQTENRLWPIDSEAEKAWYETQEAAIGGKV
jgi:hypothetical protein